jgi:hypothetical protein
MATFPSSPGFQSVNFKINTPMYKSTSFSGKTYRQAQGHQYYTFTARFPNISAQDFGVLNAFMAARLGGFDAFQIVLPEMSYTKATQTPTGTVTTTSAAAAGALSVPVTGVGAGRTVLKAGDFFKFNNHSKVYMATADLVGNSVLYFSGALVQSVPSGTALTITAVPFTVIFDNDVQEYDTGIGGITTLQLDMREVW